MSHISDDILRLTLAAVFGGLIGLERELRGRQAGFRTYILICLGSALVMVVSIEMALHPWQPTGGFNINVDPARIAYGVMTGIGFIGAGAIVHAQGGLVRGLTTAAAMWCAAAIGLAVGFGMFSISIFTTALMLVVLWGLNYVEEFLPRLRNRTITVRREYGAGCVEETVRFVASSPGIIVLDNHFRRSDNMNFADVDVHITYQRDQNYVDLQRRIDESEDYELVATREV